MTRVASTMIYSTAYNPESYKHWFIAVLSSKSTPFEKIRRKAHSLYFFLNSTKDVFKRYQQSNVLPPATGLSRFPFETNPAVRHTARGVSFQWSIKQRNKGKMDESSTSAWETLLIAGKRDDSIFDCEVDEAEEVEPGLSLDGTKDSVVSAQQEMIPDEI